MGKSVLIVDDAIFMRTMLKDIMNKNGFLVAGEAQNGQEAVEKFKDLKPDAVLLDINMPVMNGIDALKQIMEYDNTAICIICTDVKQHEMVREAIKYGAREFITKPFTAEKVVNALNNQMAQRKTQ